MKEINKIPLYDAIYLLRDEKSRQEIDKIYNILNSLTDGMIDSVVVDDGYLVITWNTDAGKQPTSIPLTDIFNPSNYYTKEGTQEYVTSVLPDVGNGKISIVKNNAQGTKVNGAYDGLIGEIDLNNSTDSLINIDIPTNNNQLVNGEGYITQSAIKNPTITIQKNNTNVGTFTTNQNNNAVINIEVPTNNNQLTNGAGYITSSSIPTTLSAFSNDTGYITASQVPSPNNAILSITINNPSGTKTNGVYDGLAGEFSANSNTDTVVNIDTDNPNAYNMTVVQETVVFLSEGTNPNVNVNNEILSMGSNNLNSND